MATVASPLELGVSLISSYFYIALGIAVAVAVLARLFGKMFNRPEWVAFSNVEMFELLKSTIIFLVIAGFHYLLTTIAIYFINSTASQSHYSYHIGDYQELHEIVVTILRNVAIKAEHGFVEAAEVAHTLKVYSDSFAKVGPGTMHIKMRIFPGVDAFLRVYETLAFLSAVSVYSITLQILGLYFAIFLTSYFLFPAGLLFRLFPPTRKAANELISMGIVVSILVPFFYILFYTILIDISIRHGWESAIDFVYEEQSSSIISRAGSLVSRAATFGMIASPYIALIASSSISLVEKLSLNLFYSIAIPTFIITLSVSLVRGVMAFLEFDATFYPYLGR